MRLTYLQTVSRAATFAAAAAAALLVSFAATAEAQSSTAIPSGISSTCATFLTELNSDDSIKSCTAPLLSATDFYTNATSGKTSTSTASTVLQESLSQLCGVNTGCDGNLIKTYLANFWSDCMSEIKAKRSTVLAYYDVLYLLNPFREAICSQDDNGNYCLTAVATTNTTSYKRDVSSQNEFMFDDLIQRRQHVSETASSANISTTSNSTNIAFLFLQPTAEKSKLCSTCAQHILASYIKFETAVPYAIGLSNSEALSGQSALYKAGKQTCGDKWAVKVNSVAGTTDFAKVAAAGVGARASTAFVLFGASAVGLALAI